MSLLSTFAILFETDAKKASGDAEDLSDSLDDVVGSAEEAVDGVDGLTEAANTGASSIGGLTNMIIGLGAAYIGFDAIASGIFDNALAIDQVGKFSETLGFNIVQVDAWGAAVERNGGSADGFRSTLESLGSSLSSIEIDGGGQAIETLAILGITATDAGGKIKSAFDVLPEIADSFENLSASKSAEFGKKLGLDQGTILLLQQGRSEVDKLVARQKMLGGVTKEGAEKAAKFNDLWLDTKRVFSSLWVSANSTILPLFESILKGFNSIIVWVRDNQTLVEGFFIGVAGVMTAIYLPAILSIAAATVIAALPFIAIGVAVAAAGAAIALLYEDTKAWVNGSKSAIGEVLGTFDEFKAKVSGIFDSIGKKWNDFVGAFSDSAKYIADFFNFSDEEIDVNATSNSSGNVGGSNSNNDRAQSIIANYSQTKLNQGGSSVNQRTQQNHISVGGANIDARGMSERQAKSAFSNGMKESIEMAMGQLDDGVVR